LSREPTDRNLIERIREGDAAAYECLFMNHAKALINFAWRFVGDAQTSENMVQEVFLKVWINRINLNPDLSIKAYLYKSVKNQALKFLRHAKVEGRRENIPIPENRAFSPEDQLNTKELESAVRKAVDELPEKRRLIFTLCKYDHLSYAEIAEIQKISIKTVETQMGRALKFLRKRLSHFVHLVLL